MESQSSATQRLPMLGYSTLLRLRPAILASALKWLCNVPRRQLILENGLRLYIDPVSRFGFRLLSQGAYEPTMSRLVELSLGDGDTFVDAGAHEGFFSLLAAHHSSGVRVYAIEPQTRLQRVLRDNISLNRFEQRIRLIRVALSDSTGTATLRLKPMMHSGSSGMFQTGVLPGGTEEVETTTIDQIVQDQRLSRIRLLKIDVEGAEHAVIRGAERTLSNQQVDILALEYHPSVGPGQNACELTHRRLLGYGYQLTEVHGQTIYHLREHSAVIARLQLDLCSNTKY
jgi:FkbM family methyltransferase